MRISYSANQEDNVVLVDLWLLDDTDPDDVVYHPELIKLATCRFLHNHNDGNLLREAYADKFFGNDDGSVKFILSNPDPICGLSIEVEVVDTSGNLYVGHTPVQQEESVDFLPRNPADEY